MQISGLKLSFCAFYSHEKSRCEENTARGKQPDFHFPFNCIRQMINRFNVLPVSMTILFGQQRNRTMAMMAPRSEKERYIHLFFSFKWVIKPCSIKTAKTMKTTAVMIFSMFHHPFKWRRSPAGTMNDRRRHFSFLFQHFA